MDNNKEIWLECERGRRLEQTRREEEEERLHTMLSLRDDKSNLLGS